MFPLFAVWCISLEICCSLGFRSQKGGLYFASDYKHTHCLLGQNVDTNFDDDLQRKKKERKIVILEMSYVIGQTWKGNTVVDEF